MRKHPKLENGFPKIEKHKTHTQRENENENERLECGFSACISHLNVNAVFLSSVEISFSAILLTFD